MENYMALKFFKSTAFISAVMVCAVFSIVYLINGLFPFGNGAIALIDVNQQVIPLLCNFKDILMGKSELFLNMANGGGMNFYGVFAFFLSSPFSFLAFFVEKQDMTYLINIMLPLKLILCAVTSSIYFKKCHPNLANHFVVILSVTYGLCGYGLQYYQNILWLDIQYIFPILLIGLSLLLNKKKPALYIISLTAVFFIAYYISYMVALFLVIYMICYVVFNRKKLDKGVIGHFIISSVISGFISAVLWLPAIIQSITSGRSNGLFNNIINSVIGSPVGNLYTKVQLYFSTAILFAVFLLYIIGRKRLKEEKIKSLKFYAILFLITFISSIFEPLNLIWHMGSYQCFPVRYGFIPLFLAIICLGIILEKTDEYREKREYKPVKKWKIALLFVIFAVIDVAVYFYVVNFRFLLSNYAQTLWGGPYSTLLLGILFLIFTAMYFTALWLYKKNMLSKICTDILIFLVIFGEGFTNITVYTSWGDRITDIKNYYRAMELSDRIDDEQFYRVGTDDNYFYSNTLGAMGYNSISHYTSLNSWDYMSAMKRLGYSSYWMKVDASGGTEFSNALLCEKYMLTDQKAYKDSVCENDIYKISKSDYFLPLGLVTESDLSLKGEMPKANRIEIQNEMFKSLFNCNNDLFKKCNYDFVNDLVVTKNSNGKYMFSNTTKFRGSIFYKIKVEGKKTLYFDCFDKITNNDTEHIYNTFTVIVNSNKVAEKYPHSEKNGVLNLGTYEDEIVNVELQLLHDTDCASFGVYEMDNVLLEKSIDTADTLDMKADNNKITGKYYNDSEKYKWVFISVPYQESFTAVVNNREAECKKVYSDFIGIRLLPGQNNIVISYKPPYFNIGLCVSALGVLVLLAYTIFNIRKRKAEKREKL